MDGKQAIWAMGLAAALALSACGARTSLDLADASFDAPPDAPDALDAPDTHDAGPTCVTERRPLTPTSADVVFTIDRSGSMRLTIEGEETAMMELWRWSILRDALAATLPTLGPRVNLGAKFYPDPIRFIGARRDLACRTSPGIDVPISAGGASPVLSTFDVASPNGGTPTAPAIGEATSALRARRSPRRFIVLTTDGGPNCNPDLVRGSCACTGDPADCAGAEGSAYECLDDVRTLDRITEAADAGIPVFVVGIEDPTRPDLGDFMDAMAIAGGRPRVGTPRQFYAVRSEADLREALDVITSSIARCGFVAAGVPADDASFAVWLDGELVPASDVDGWFWTDRALGELELVGSYCDRIAGDDAELVTCTLAR